MLDHLQWRRAAVLRAHHQECSLCHHLLGNLPCCQMTKTKPLQSAVLTPTLNIRMFIYRQCNDALQEDCTATVQAELWWVTFSQEGITMATSTSPPAWGQCACVTGASPINNPILNLQPCWWCLRWDHILNPKQGTLGNPQHFYG